MRKVESIPTTRNWYMPFRKILNDKVEKLKRLTNTNWSWDYDGNRILPFRLFESHGGGSSYDAGYKTDSEIYENICGMLFGLEFQNSTYQTAFDNGYDDGYDRGKEEGYDEGYEDGFSDGKNFFN